MTTTVDSAIESEIPVRPSGLSTTAVVNVVTVVAVTLFWLVSTSWHPWNLFARAGFSADFYDEQARVFLHGRLAVDPTVPGPEGFLIDGKTYLYYGPFLSIVRMPFQLFGDLFTSRLVRVSMLVAVAVLCRWSARIARAAGRVVIGEPSRSGSFGDGAGTNPRIGEPPSRSGSFGDGAGTNPRAVVDERWIVGLFTAAVACSPALFAAGWISVYNETELWAFTLALVSATLIVEWSAGGFVSNRLLGGAVAAALAATLTRAPIGIGVALAIGVCGVVLAWRSRADGLRAGWWAIVGGVVPLIAHAAVNFAKFGTLFSVPGGQQLLSLQDPTRAAWFAGNNDSFFSSRFLSTTVVQYLRPDAIRVERLVPFLRFGPVGTNRASYPLLGNTPASSLTLTATLLMVLATVGVVWLVRHRSLTWGLVVVCTTLGALPTLLIGFLANRYLIDMLPPLVVAGALGVWVVGGWGADRPTRRWLRLAGVVLVVWGAWVNLSLATWTLDQKSAGFTEFRYRVDSWIFPAPSPGLTSIQPGDTAARDGVVAIHVDPDLGCAGVYTAEQGAWVTVDRTAARELVTTITADRVPSPLAAGATWAVDLDLSDPAAAHVVVTDAAGVVVSDQVVADWSPLDDGESVDATVVADPVTGEYIDYDRPVVDVPSGRRVVDEPDRSRRRFVAGEPPLSPPRRPPVTPPTRRNSVALVRSPHQSHRISGRSVSTSEDLGEEELRAVFAWVGEEVFGGADLDDLAGLHEHHAIGDLASETHLVGHHDHRHAAGGEVLHRVEHLVDHLGVERGGRLVEQHHLGLHGERPGDRHALLLTARHLARVLARLLGNLDLFEQIHRQRLGLRFRHLAHLAWREGDVVEHAEMWEEVEALEHHARLAADLGDVADVVRQFGAIDRDAAGVVLLEPIDAADHRGLARPGGPDDHDDLPGGHLDVDVLERLELAEELVDVREFDHRHAVARHRGGVAEHRLAIAHLAALAHVTALISLRLPVASPAVDFHGSS